MLSLPLVMAVKTEGWVPGGVATELTRRRVAPLMLRALMKGRVITLFIIGVYSLRLSGDEQQTSSEEEEKGL